MDAQKFEDRIFPVTESGCWLWMGATDGRYGKLTIKRDGRWVSERAHRLSYENRIGRRIGAGLVVCHKCDTPLCVNPDHLFEGTRGENSCDMFAKGRHGRRKLTANDVAEVLASPLSNHAFARKLGVYQSTIGDIRNGVTHKIFAARARAEAN